MSNLVIHVSQLENIVWNDAENHNYILTDATVIWQIFIPDHISKINVLWPLLHSNEQEKADRHHREEARQRFIIGRVI